jgi:hypothetical protein
MRAILFGIDRQQPAQLFFGRLADRRGVLFEIRETQELVVRRRFSDGNWDL